MTPDFLSALGSVPHWAMVGITLLVVGATVGLHYEVLERMNLTIPRLRIQPRARVLVLIFVLLGAHVAEIWIFGLGLYWVGQVPSLGHIAGVEDFKLLDAVYLSATTYSTLGYGDLVPRGPVRLLAATESLLGLVLITWSASFTYLEMQRNWRPR